MCNDVCFAPCVYECVCVCLWLCGCVCVRARASAYSCVQAQVLSRWLAHPAPLMSIDRDFFRSNDEILAFLDRFPHAGTFIVYSFSLEEVCVCVCVCGGLCVYEGVVCV